MTSLPKRGITPGLPTNQGSFKADERTDAGVALIDDASTSTPADLDEATLEAWADAYLASHDDREPTAEEVAEAAERERVLKMVSMAQDSADFWERAKNARERSRGVWEADDIAQETLLAMLRKDNNGGIFLDPKGWQHAYSMGLASTAGNKAVRKEDRRALRLLHEKQEIAQRAKENEAARRADEAEAAGADADTVAAIRRDVNLTTAEVDALAREVENEWDDPRRKPTKDWRRLGGQMEISLGQFESAAASEAFLAGAASRSLGLENADNNIAPHSDLDRALGAIEGHDGNMHDAKRLLWNALAQRDPAVPAVTAGSASQRSITAARGVMKNVPNGALGAIAMWQSASADPADEKVCDAFFLPWGSDPDVRDAVCAQMLANPLRAEVLWDSAMRYVNNRNVEKAGR